MTAAQLFRLVMIGATCAMAVPLPAAAQSGKLESTYVVLGGPSSAGTDRRCSLARELVQSY
jgi:hypothetical protein